MASAKEHGIKKEEKEKEDNEVCGGECMDGQVKWEREGGDLSKRLCVQGWQFTVNLVNSDFFPQN